ncbi:MAG: cold shock domain-containing protein CspD [Porticoccus sp.]
MHTGTVKWFNNAKGYGFILSSDGTTDIFAHYSAITMEGYKTLKAGQEVIYDLVEGEKGLHATNIATVGTSVSQNDDLPAPPLDVESDTIDDQ